MGRTLQEAWGRRLVAAAAAVVVMAAHSALADDHYDCGYKTVWLEKTEYRPVPYYNGG